GDAAALVATLAAAVEYAHRQGIIHRDLKPANVLLGEDGTPFVTDFGLAREAHASGLTLDGAAVGTPAYMAPEQASGRHEAVGPHTDVFGLGAILFQLLTGRPPYPGPDVRATLMQAERGRVPPVREVNPAVPPALARVVDRALAPDVGRRYPSAARLEADLRRYLRSRRWPWLAVAAGLVGVAASALVAVLAWNAGQGRRPEPEPARPASPLYADFKIRFWSPTSPHRKGRSITEPGVLPLRAGELVRFELDLNRRGHVYILWIDGRGKIDPFYPWDRDDPRALFKPAPVRPPIDRVAMPPEDDAGYPIEGESGLETVLVMVRGTPLPADVKLGEVIGPVPASPLRDAGEAAMRGWNGKDEIPPFDLKRGPAKEAKAIDEPVLRLIAKVRPHFEQVRAVRFAYQK
ncbi:MAG: protein kinase domain-containing protein, partial [Gemmataceae bacterium]